MKEVIAIHGWAFDSHTWKLWDQLFTSRGWIWKSFERGYGGLCQSNPHWHENSSSEQTQQRLLIGHSLGPHLVESTTLSKATHVVLLASFSSFIPKSNRSRVLLHGLKSMQKKLGTSEEKKMLRAFYEKAYAPLSPNSFSSKSLLNGISKQGRDLLFDDLNLLINSKEVPAGFPVKAKVLIVEDTQDSILLPEARKSLKEDLQKILKSQPNHWILNGSGHALSDPSLIQRVEDWSISAR